MTMTRKTTPANIEAALEAVVHDLKELERLARQTTPTQMFETVLPWCARRRTEVEDILGAERAITHIEISDDERDGGWWTVYFNEGALRVERGKIGKADLGVHLSIFTWEDLQKGDDDPAKAYAAGRVKFSGNPAVGVRIMGRLLKYL